MAFDIQGAKQEGYSDTEIADYLATQNKFDAAGARKEGYGDTEIISHLQGVAAPKDESWGIGDTLRGAGAVLGGFAAMPVAGLGGLAKLITSGSLDEASKTMEGISSVPGKILNTDRQREAVGNVGELISKPFQMAGEGWRQIGEATGIPYAEPVLGTIGEAAAMVGVPAGIGKTIRAVKGKVSPTKPIEPVIEPKITPEQPTVQPEIVQPGASSIAEIPKVDVPLEPGMAESKLSVRTEADAIAKKLTNDFGDLPEYKTMNMADQANRAAEILDADYATAKRMAMGEIPTPPEVRPASVYEAVKIRAIKEGDVDTLQSLATESTIPTILSEYGQAIKAADSRLMDDPVRAMQDIGKARAENAAKITGKTPPPPVEVVKLKQAADMTEKALDEYTIQKEVDGILKTDNPLNIPKVKYGSRNKFITTEKYNALKAELSQQLGSQLSAGIDPTIAMKMSQLGAYHFEAGVREFGAWSNTMIKDVGEQIKPYLEDIWKQTNEAVRNDIALRTRKTRLANETKELTTKMDNLDFAKKEKRKTVLDMEGLRLQAERDRAKKNYQAAVEAAGTVTKEEATKIVDYSKKVAERKAAYNEATQEWSSPKAKAEYGAAKVLYTKYIEDLADPKLTLRQMISNRLKEAKVTWKENPMKAEMGLLKDTVSAISDASISFVASLDNSFLGRQGLNTLMTHPTIWADAAKKSFSDIYQTLTSKHGNAAVKDAVMADVYSRPNYMNGNYERAKLIPKTEEQYPTSIPGRMPVLGRVFQASENAFVNSALRMRVNTFDLLQDIARKYGVDVNDKVQVQEMGKLINSVTARGSLGRWGEGGVIRIVLWAPKMLKGNWDVLTAHTGGARLDTAFARHQARVNIAKIVAETAGIAALANAINPGSVETDPRSSDFLKIRSGNTRFDITGGKGSLITLAARAISMQTKSNSTGKVTPLNSDKYKARTVADVGTDFLVNKTTPIARQIVDVARGRDFNGKKPTRESIFYNLSTPIGMRNFIDNFYGPDPDGSVAAVVGSVVDLFGINANTYKPSNNKLAPLK